MTQWVLTKLLETMMNPIRSLEVIIHYDVANPPPHTSPSPGEEKATSGPNEVAAPACQSFICSFINL